MDSSLFFIIGVNCHDVRSTLIKFDAEPAQHAHHEHDLLSLIYAIRPRFAEEFNNHLINM